MAEPASGVSARLWDGPVRIVHWALVVLLLVAWFSAEEQMLVHRVSGYAVIGLVVFRIWWGFAGGGAARFSSFVKGPRATLAYLRTLGDRAPSATPGHNALGAWSILAILATLAVVSVSGLFAVDVDAFEAGPMSDRVSFELGREIAEWHELAFRVLQGLVVLHLAAIAYYWLYKRTNLVGPMITGRRVFPSEPGLAGASPWALAAGVILAAGVAWALSKGLRF